MATTFEMPKVHNHGVGHGHSHSRKLAVQRMPLTPTSVNGGYQVNGGLKIHEQNHQQRKSTDTLHATHHHQPGSSLQLPKPPSFSTPTKDRSKSMERRKSVGLPTHLRLQGNGYGFPPPSSQSFRVADPENGTKWATRKELVNAILVPLPCILASLAYGYGISRQPSISSQSVGSPLEGAPNENNRSSSQVSGLILVCALTSLTLLLVGLGGKLNQTFGTTLDRRKTAYGTGEGVKKTPWAQTAHRISSRLLTTGLPFYATSKLGGVRVAMVVLLALASNIMTISEAVDLMRGKHWRQMFTRRMWTLGAVILQLICDLSFTNSLSFVEKSLGYLALALCVLVLPPSFPSERSQPSAEHPAVPASLMSTSTIHSASWETPPAGEFQNSTIYFGLAPLIHSADDIKLTIWSGTSLGVFTTILYSFISADAGTMSRSQLAWGLLSTCAGALSLVFADPKSLNANKGLGFVLGSFVSCLFLVNFSHEWRPLAYQSVLIGISFAALKLDTQKAASSSHSTHQDHGHDHGKLHVAETVQMSKFSALFLRKVQHWPLLRDIIAEKDSRRIFYFMSLNFAFMLVQTFYGIATGSLGLLSDSIHMLFDCLALAVGLCAAVMSKWPPSTRFPYGYGKMDTLAGFANGIFLMLISIEIVYEALERLAGGNRIQRLGELLTVSILGLGVNIIGLTSFGHAHHGHGHSHGHEGHDHSGHSHSHERHDASGHSHTGLENHPDHSHHDHAHHDHAHHDHFHQHLTPQKVGLPLSAPSQGAHFHGPPSTSQSPSPSVYSSVPATPSKPAYSQSHGPPPVAHGHHHHHHHHGNENMHGIFLHVLADTLGSVAVVISTILIHFYGWSGFDPLASCLIAILIFASAIPLVTSSAKTLLLTVPEDTEYDLREALAGLSVLRGVVGYAVPKFWLSEGGERRVLGVIHIIGGRGADLEDVKDRSIAYLREQSMEVLVQVEREGVGSCWCQTTR